MPVYRYYVKESLAKGSSVSLEEKELHHLVHVTRMSVGDKVELVNGEGQLAIASIQQLSKKKTSLKIEELHSEQKPPFEIILAQALPQFKKLDFLLEKGTELGVTQLWLFPAELSERHSFTEHQMERLENLAVAAMKQCGRLYLPEIKVLPHFSEWKEVGYPMFYGDVNPQAKTLIEVWREDPPQKGAVFFTGPESGFTDEEHQLLKGRGAKGVKLHRNILRTETASIAALSLISQLSE